MNDQKAIHIIFTSEGFKELEFLAKFLYPENIAAASYDLNIKSWHVLRAFQQVNEEVSNKKYVEKILEKHLQDLIHAINNHPEKGPCIVYIQNYRISFAVEILFYEIKAFLDFFAQKIIGKALNMNSCPTFKSKGNHADPGGKFLEALEHNVPNKLKAKAAAISEIIKKHKPLWINATIKDRDTATHRGTLQTKVTMNSGLLSAPVTNFSFETFFDNNNLAEYNKLLVEIFLKFIEEILQEIVN